MSASFRDRYGPCALVAGASEGLGAAFAEELAKRGLDVVLVARRREPLERLAADLRERFRVEATPLVADLAERDDLERVAKALDVRPIGLLVCNAALAPIGEYLEQTVGDHERLVDLNCRATAVLAHHAGRTMLPRGRGGVVIMTSLASLQGTALTVHYAASKAYLRVLAEGLWEEWRAHGVDVVACMAGPTETPTWTASHARRTLGIPAVQAASDVVHEALAALGQGPVCVPSAANKMTYALVKHGLSTTAAVRLVSWTTRRMYRR